MLPYTSGKIAVLAQITGTLPLYFEPISGAIKTFLLKTA
jgi:hypothetical protein